MSPNDALKPIPTPAGRYWQLVRQRVLPVVVWAAAAAVFVGLQYGQPLQSGLKGLVRTNEVAVAPAFDGTLQQLNVALLESVEAGQVVAVMGDEVLRAEIAAHEAELARLRSALRAESERIRVEYGARTGNADDKRRFVIDAEEARLDYLDRLARQASDTILLDSLRVEKERQARLVDSGVGDTFAYDEARFAHEALREQVAGQAVALEEAQARLAAALERRDAYEAGRTAVDAVVLSEPFVAAIAVEEAWLESVKVRRAQHTVKAPISGKVRAIFHRAGEVVLAGTPMISIANDQGREVVAYVPQDVALDLRAGQTVSVRESGSGGKVAPARVLRVGPQVEPLPGQLLRSPDLPQWGTPVLVGDLPLNAFRPGQVVSVEMAGTAPSFRGK